METTEIKTRSSALYLIAWMRMVGTDEPRLEGYTHSYDAAVKRVAKVKRQGDRAAFAKIEDSKAVFQTEVLVREHDGVKVRVFR